MKKIAPIIAFLLFFSVGFAQTQPSNLPYPIIFVHGIDSDNTMWNDITNHLNLWFGSTQVVNLVLNASFDTTRFIDDVIIEFNNTPPLSSGNIFTVNFKNWWNENATDPMLLQGQNHGHILTQSQSNESSILKQGYALKLVIEKVLQATNSDGVILVGHSMGGLAIREYLQRKDENGSQMWWVDKNDVISGHMVKKVFTLNTPHLGSSFAEPNGKTTLPNVYSEATRDLRDKYIGTDGLELPGVYLFGGKEKSISIYSGFHNYDVNCDGDDKDSIIGISQGTSYNPNLRLPSNIYYTWGTSTGDWVVPHSNSWLYDQNNVAQPAGTDTLLTDDGHLAAKHNVPNIMRGLDEPNTKELAYDLTPKNMSFFKIDRTLKGFITYQPAPSSFLVDNDFYKVVLPAPGDLKVSLGGESSGIQQLAVISGNNTVAITTLPGEISLQLAADTHYIRVRGFADDQSWQNPYTLSVKYDIGAPPQVPNNLQPSNGAIFVHQSLSIDWSDVEKAISYDFQLATDTLFSNLVYFRTGLTSSTMDVSNLELEKMYFWRVRSVNYWGTSEWSPVWSFTTEDAIAVGNINSKLTGGNWGDPDTWFEGVVPSETESVVIRGPVTINNDVSCKNLMVLSEGMVQSGVRVYTTYLTINGNLVNHGVIRNNPSVFNGFMINLSGTVYCNGELNIAALILNGTTDQYLYLGEGRSFNCDISFSNQTGNLVAGSDLRFMRNVSLGGRRFVTGDYSVTGGYLMNGKISQSNFRFYGDGSLGGMQMDVRNLYMRGRLQNCTFQGPVTFHNRIMVVSFDTIYGDLTIQDTIESLNHSTNHHTLQVNGNMLNNGIIIDRLNSDSYLDIKITRDLTNNGGMRNFSINLEGNVTNNSAISVYAFSINGTTDQYLYQGEGGSFNCDIYFTNLTGNLVAGSDLRFMRNVSLYGGRLVTGEYSVTGGYLINGKISQSNFRFYGDGTLRDMQLDVRNLFMRGKIQNCALQGPVTFHNRMMIWSSNTINGDLTVQDTLESLDYSAGEHILQVNGDLVNNGIIRNNPNNPNIIFRLNLAGDITNNHVISVNAFSMNGTADQYLYLGEGGSFNCDIYFTNLTGNLVAGSDLRFMRNVSLYGGRLVTGEYSVTGGYLMNGKIDQPNFRFYGNGTLRDMELNVRNLYMKGMLQNCTIQGPVTFHERIQIFWTTLVNGDLIVQDTLENLDYSAGEHILQVNGDLVNNGIIRNNPNNPNIILRLNLARDLNNSGEMRNSSYYLIGNSSRTLYSGDNCVSNFYSDGDSVILMGHNKLPNLNVNSGACVLAKNSELLFLGASIHGNFHNYGTVVIGRPISSYPAVYDFFMSSVKLGTSIGLNNLVVTNFGNQVPSLFSSAVKNYWGVFPDPTVPVNSQMMTFFYKDGMLNGNEEDKLEIFHSGNGVTDWTKLSNPLNTTRNLAENSLQITDLPIKGYFAIASSVNFPSQVILTTPDNNRQNLNLPVLFKWQSDYLAERYLLSVAKDSLFTELVFADSSLSDTTKLLSNLENNVRYFWRVKAGNQTGWGDWSNTWRFTTIIEKPTVPVLATPANNSNGLLNPITAKWNKSLRVEKYKLQVSVDNLFTSFILNDSTLTDTTKLLPNLANYSQYYWRVKAVNVGGESDWSTVWNFKTLGNPYASNLITPLEASVNHPLNGLTFKWTKAQERIETIQKYQLQISTDSLFGSFFINDTTLTDTSRIVNGMGYLTKYFWRVRAQNQTGWGDWSETWKFTTIIEKPSIPVLATPLNDSKGLLNPITSKWNKSPRVEKYKLQVSTSSLFTSFVFSDSTITDTTQLLPNLSNYSQFYWRVKAVNVGGESDWSTVWNFKILGNPYASNLLTPSDASVNQPLNGLIFKWTKAQERIETIQKYQLQISIDSLFGSFFINDTTLTDTSRIVNGMGYLTKYFWRVRAQNQTGWGDWSEAWKFTTISEKPSVPVLATPLNDSKGLLNPITVKWNKSLRVEKYKLQVSTNNLFTSFIVNDTTLTDTTKLLPNLANYSQYYWRVKAINVGGESDWSTVWNFKTLGNPYASNLLTPLDASINQPLSGLTFKWSKALERIETIQKYQLQISNDSLFGTLFVNDSTLVDTSRIVNGMGYLTKYFWRVRAQNQTGWGDWSNTWRFTTIIEKPTIPVLATPLNDSKGLLNPITAKWNKSLRVEKYKLQVSTNNLFTTFILNDSTITDTTKVLPNLANYSQYYWRVKAVNVGGESDWSTVWNFKTLGNPYASNLVEPINASVNHPINGLTFKWTKAQERIESIQKYQLQISADSLFGTLFINDSTLVDTSMIINGMGFYTKYFWRVRAQNQTGWGDWSEAWKFTTISEKPSVPVLATPLNDSKGLLNPITVKWNKSLRVEKYKLQVSTDNLFTSFIVNDSTLSDTIKLLPNIANYSQYYWRVKAVNVGGESDWSSVWNFKTLGNPYASNLVEPLNNTVNHPLNGLTFKWTKAQERIESIQKYQLQISTDSLFGSFFINDTTLTDTSRIVNGMGFYTKYFWRVRAQNQTGWGDWSETWKFTTIIEKPTVPVLALPFNNSNGLLNPITAKWNKSLRVEKYKLQVSTDSLFGSLIVNDSTIVDTAKMLPELANYTKYFWRAKAVNIGGESNWSNVWNFKTLGNPCSVILASPENGVVNNPVNSVTFKWFKPQERVETILKYHFQLSTDSLFGSISFSDSTFILDTTTTGSGLSYLTTYFWRVRAKNETGWGDWSQVWNLTTIIDKPSIPLLVSPANNVTQLLQPVVLKWRQSSRVEKYTLEVSESPNFTTLFLVDSTLTDTIGTLPQLQNAKTWYWRVKAKNIGGSSEYSAVWNFRTLGLPLTVNLIAPSNGSINLPVNDVQLQWSTAGEQTLGSITSGRKSIKKDRIDEESVGFTGGSNTPGNGNLFASGSPNITSGIESIGNYWLEIKTDTNSASLFYSDSTLTDTTKLMSGFVYQTTYFWRVKASNEVGWGSFSGWNRFTTTKKPISTPTELTATATAVKQVTLSWSDNSDNELGFIILRKTGDSTSTTLLERIDSVGADVTGFVDTTVTDTTYYSYKVMAYNADTLSEQSNYAIVFTLTGIKEFSSDIPKEFSLYQNYPNPFNPSTIIRFALPKDAHVEIELYSIHGELMNKLVSEYKQAGYYEISLEIPFYASGIYFYRIVASPADRGEPFMQTRKFILMK